MKKLVIVLMIIIFFVSSILNINIQNKDSDSRDKLLNSISRKLIRFHVIANSDSEDDQALKIKVKDAIIDYISPKLSNSQSINQSREILKSYDKEILKLASGIIKKNGYSYSVASTLGRENFPDKNYGNITLPQGEYEAYRVVIGSGKGKNWWCVMFPPLCFVDETRGQVSVKETEKQMKKVLSDDEYNEVNNEGDKEVKIRFKTLELVEDFIDKIKS
ncbi:MAG: stage II sporulation protein R [Clostridiaceae bacterium]